VIDLGAELRELVRAVVREELAAVKPLAPVELVTVAEYARRRSISTSTVRAAIREGRLDAQRIGRAVRIQADAAIGKPIRTRGIAEAARRADLRLVGGVRVR